MLKRTMLFTIAFAALLFAGCAAKSDTIKVGAVLPVSGPVSAYGSQTRDGILLAFEEINAAGGINGKKLELIVEDDEANPEKTINAFKKLVAKDKVDAVLGGLTSKCTLAITAQAQAKKVILLTPSSTNDTVTDAGDFIFRACYKDSFQGVVVAQFAKENLKAMTAAVLFDNTNDYSKGLNLNFTKKFESLGGKVIVAESYASGDKDFNAQLTKIKALKPDVLFIPDYYSTVSLIAKQVRAQGLTVPLLGADGWDEIVNNAGDEVLNAFYSNHYTTDADDADVKKFIASFEGKFKVVPNALAALGYDAGMMLADAYKVAGTGDSQKLRDALAATNKKFVTGLISFDATRNPVKSAVMLEIVKDANGKLATKFAGTVNP